MPLSVQDRKKDQKCYIRILPDELLSAIFDAGAQSADSDPGFPMIVSAVSFYWRQVAINKPSLWTSIVVDFSNIRNKSCNFILFFERSKAQPLYITIHFFRRLLYFSRFCKDLSEAISKNTSRIREIVVSIEFMSDFHDFVSPFNSLAFPILSRLEIDSNAPPCFLQHAPLFHEAKHIRSMVFPRCPTCAPLGPDLTHLEIRRLTCSVEQLRAVFQASPSLHTLTLYKLGVSLWEEDNLSPIVASSLHTLNFTFHEQHSFDSGCMCLLSHLETPNLISLAVKLSSGDFNFAQHFSTLPKIEKLKIVDFILTPEDGLVIQQWTTLAHVELIRTDHTFLWSSPQANDSPDPWKNLTAVTLDGPSFASRAEMVEAIRRSYAQSPRIITLNIDHLDRYQMEELQLELPNVVLNKIRLESDPGIRYDTSEDDDSFEHDDYWSVSDESDYLYGDAPDVDDIGYELDVELDPYSHDYDDDDIFDEEDEE